MASHHEWKKLRPEFRAKDAEDAKEKLWRSSKESAVAQIVADEESPDEGNRPPHFGEIDTEATARLKKLTSWRVQVSNCRKKRPRRFSAFPCSFESLCVPGVLCARSNYLKLRLGGPCEPRCGNVPLTRSLALPSFFDVAVSEIFFGSCSSIARPGRAAACVDTRHSLF